MKILAVETSCDETAVALIEATGDLDSPKIKVLNKKVHSQIEDHKEYGGVYPSLAKREHARNIVPVTSEVIKNQGTLNDKDKIQEQTWDSIKIILEREPDLFEATKNFLENTPKPNVDLLAVTSGPGLEPALWVGINFAKALSVAWNIPLMPVNHMEGHIASILINQNDDSKIKFPALALLISGGHTELVKMNDWGEHKILGKTKDDAVGESYDKVARMLGFSYPGGPEISKLAQNFRESRMENKESEEISFPRPMINSNDLDFSFSGLKTSVLYKIRDMGNLDEAQKSLIAYEFEEAVADVLTSKVTKAMQSDDFKDLIVAGGVVANKYLRERLEKSAKESNATAHFPQIEDCTDNAQMIGATAYIKSFKEKATINPEIVANGNLSY